MKNKSKFCETHIELQAVIDHITTMNLLGSLTIDNACKTQDFFWLSQVERMKMNECKREL
jgi:hypothetical protein